MILLCIYILIILLTLTNRKKNNHAPRQPFPRYGNVSYMLPATQLQKDAPLETTTWPKKRSLLVLMILETGGQPVACLTEALVTCRVHGIQRIFWRDHVSKASSHRARAFVMICIGDGSAEKWLAGRRCDWTISVSLHGRRRPKLIDVAETVDWHWITGISQSGLSYTVGHT